MDFKITCWSCGHDAMQYQDEFYQCSNCSATWSELPKSHRLSIQSVIDSGTGGASYSPRKTIGRGARIKSKVK